MVYEDICNFGMDQLVITQYKKILKILQENSNIFIQKKSKNRIIRINTGILSNMKQKIKEFYH